MGKKMDNNSGPKAEPCGIPYGNNYIYDASVYSGNLNLVLLGERKICNVFSLHENFRNRH